MKLAGEAAGNLKFQGKKIHIYQDLSADQLKKRAASKDVKDRLREARVKYGLLHPCKLIVTHQETMVTFIYISYYDQVIKPSLHDPQV